MFPTYHKHDGEFLKENHRNANGRFNLFSKMENIIYVNMQVTVFVSVIYINKQNIDTLQKKSISRFNFTIMRI